MLSELTHRVICGMKQPYSFLHSEPSALFACPKPFLFFLVDSCGCGSTVILPAANAGRFCNWEDIVTWLKPSNSCSRGIRDRTFIGMDSGSTLSRGIL